MHHSDLHLPSPSISSRHAPPPAAASTSTWHQSLSNSPVPRKRNVERACDECRRRKTRCDGPKMPDNVCTNCVQNRKLCTYIESSKPRGPPKAYVSSLEDRVERMEALLKRLRPETDFSPELGPPIVRGSWKNEPSFSASTSAGGKKIATRALHQSHPFSTSAALNLSQKAPSTSVSPVQSDAQSDGEGLKEELIQTMKRLTILDKGPQDKANRINDGAFRFHGKSANYNLVMFTREMRTKYLLESMGADVDTIAKELERVRVQPNPHASALEGGLRRREYWRSPDWELDYEGESNASETFSGLFQRWPPSDLETALIDLYFLHCNSMFPLLHRPTFTRHFTERLHGRDIWFACTCMSLFALASRYTNDVRVLLDEPVETPLDENAELSWQTAGFKYLFPILEVANKKSPILNPASLFEIQTLCLTAQFLNETRWQRGVWHTIGVGIRKMQDIGAHSRHSYAKAGPTVENELWKRVWWYLNGLDRIQSAILGRPCAVKEADFTVEYPLEVDDDFWEHDNPQPAFRQPPDKPSTVAAFNLWLQLTDFTASALPRFNIVKHDGPSGLCAEDILKQLNQNLTEWVEKVPQHLKWSVDIEDVILANQSATLYTTYNLVTILLQRAFLPSSVALLSSPRDTRPTPPGLANAMTARAVSVNAAKAIAGILAVVHKRALSNIPLLLVGAEITVAVLCIDVWIIKARDENHTARDGKISPSAMQSIESHMQDIKSLLAALRWATPRWETAQERLSYLEKVVPELDKEYANPRHVSTSNVVQERQLGHLDLSKFPQHSTAMPSRPDVSYFGPHVPGDIGMSAIGTSMRHGHRREEGPWLRDLSRQYAPPRQMPTQPTPRISSHPFLPRIRGDDSTTEHPQRPLDEWTYPQKSYTTPFLHPTSGHLHTTRDTNNPPEFTRVKSDPDADMSMPPLRMGWAYVTHHPSSVHSCEASPVRGNHRNASTARLGDSPADSPLLSHLHRPAREFTAPPPHGTYGDADRDHAM